MTDAPHTNMSSCIAARHLLEYQGFDDPNEMFEEAFHDLMKAADRMMQNKVIASKGECEAHNRSRLTNANYRARAGQ